MKQKIITLIILFTGIYILQGCKKDDFDFQNEYRKSYSKWSEFKESSGNSYKYIVLHTSWTGTTMNTEITIKNGKVVERAFTLSVIEEGSTGIPNEVKSWIENKNEIGKHENSGAAAAITLDEVYRIAKDILSKNSHTTFEAKNDGLISLCGKSVPECMDDCFQGIYIISIDPLTEE